jgi:beta-galactosidase
VLAADESWAEAGHEVAWGQAQVAAARPVTTTPVELAHGPGRFDEFGRLAEIGGLAVAGPVVDLWRAPTDNDIAYHGDSVAVAWRALGLDRLTHRTVEIRRDATELLARTRIAPAAVDRGFAADYHWTAADGGLLLRVDLAPIGAWVDPLPRIGVTLALPGVIERVTWFGAGPGEAYRDMRRAARVGRFTASVAELQTPYLFPQENGNRTDTRWAELSTADGRGLRIEGRPVFDFTARRWTDHDLDEARHTSDLRPRDQVFLRLDLAHNGLGSASCGPGVLPPHRLTLAGPVSFTVAFSSLTTR